MKILPISIRNIRKLSLWLEDGTKDKAEGEIEIDGTLQYGSHEFMRSITIIGVDQD